MGLKPATSARCFATLWVFTRSTPPWGARRESPASGHLQRLHPARRLGQGPHPGPAADTSPALRGDRLAHYQRVLTAHIADISEADSLRARPVHLEDTARFTGQWFQIHRHGRSESPLPGELPPKDRERIDGPIGLGGWGAEHPASAASPHRRTRRADEHRGSAPPPPSPPPPFPIFPFSGGAGLGPGLGQALRAAHLSFRAAPSGPLRSRPRPGSPARPPKFSGGAFGPPPLSSLLSTLGLQPRSCRRTPLRNCKRFV